MNSAQCAMYDSAGVKAIIFGGTTEGRKLCETCVEYAIPVIYCVAGVEGARHVGDLSDIDVRMGRMGAAEMMALLEQGKPALVVDATHPYAQEASRNIAAACQGAGVRLLRVSRESTEVQGCKYFSGISDLLAWLERETGNVFVTTGASHAKAFTGLADYRNRLWMRILPGIDSLKTCLDSGYRPERLICMQGPFSEELNRAMFKEANARILVTKNSGAVGGFTEKVMAAQSLGMLIAVLSKPEETGGVSLEEACRQIGDLVIK